MDFINKNDGFFSETAIVLRALHNGLDFLDAAGYRRKIDKGRFRSVRDDARQGCLADTRRSPKNHG